METTGGQAESLAVPGEVGPELYGVYRPNDRSPQLEQTEQTEWVIRGTDGKLYLVPSESGGWLRHAEYQGRIGELTAVSQEEARSICWMVYGDVGAVTIQGANLDRR